MEWWKKVHLVVIVAVEIVVAKEKERREWMGRCVRGGKVLEEMAVCNGCEWMGWRRL